MAGTSLLLRPVLQQALRLSLKQSWKKGVLYLPAVTKLYGVRSMADHGPRRMEIKASSYEWESFKDDINRFLWLGFLPMGLLICYCNMFVGQAELKDIPEGYEPEHWEYYKGPIQRWFAKNVYGNQEDEYEKIMQFIHDENEQIKMRQLDAKVKVVMSEKLDYKGWYYMPVDKTNVDAGRRIKEDWKDSIGSKMQ